MNDIDQKLKNYIEKNIFPKYEKFYSHGMIHINNVIKNCLMMAEYYELDKNMCYTMASYHDAGLGVNRDNHEYESGKILMNDKKLKSFFTIEQLLTMKEAIEDHRGSRKERPRNIYGEILSDSDRDFDIKLLVKRQLSTSIKNYPEYKTFEEHFKNCYEYLLKRINSKGHFNLWTNNPIFVKQREEFEKIYLDEQQTKEIYKKEYERISKDGTIDKIINYYEDY